MKRYAKVRTEELVDRLEKQVRLAYASRDPDAVHDLRVAIRRLRGCLRTFSQFIPKKARRKARRRAGSLMDLAAAVRDRDIAIELFAAAGLTEDSPVMARLHKKRERADGRLLAKLERWIERDFPADWKAALGL